MKVESADEEGLEGNDAQPSRPARWRAVGGGGDASGHNFHHLGRPSGEQVPLGGACQQDDLHCHAAVRAVTRADGCFPRQTRASVQLLSMACAEDAVRSAPVPTALPPRRKSEPGREH